MSTLASIYLASLSNAYRHTYCAQISNLTVTVLWKSEIPPKLHSSIMKWKIFLPQALSAGTIFSLHACGTDADCACVSINYGRLATPRRHARSQYSLAGDDILTISTGHRYYCPAMFLPIYYLLSPSWITRLYIFLWPKKKQWTIA